MNTLDIIIAVPLVYAVYQGFRKGIIAQLGGLIGIILGVWLAFRYCGPMGAALPVDPDIASYVGFLVVFGVTLIGVGTISWLLGKVFSLVGLGMFNRLLGVVLSVVKTALVLSVLLLAFRSLNDHAEIIEKEQFEKSTLYPALGEVSDFVFPYFELYKGKWLDPKDESDEEGIGD